MSRRVNSGQLNMFQVRAGHYGKPPHPLLFILSHIRAICGPEWHNTGSIFQVVLYGERRCH